MRIWIIGKRGMLGQSVIRECERRGVSYFATSSDEADLTDLDSLKAVADRQEFTHVVNCAAYTNVEKAEEESERAFAINGQGVANLAMAADAKIIHFSTDYVFDGKQNEPYREDAKCNPLSVYGKSKREGELFLQESGIEHLILRTSWLYGFSGIHFVNKMISLMKRKENLSVIKDQFGSPTFCDDLSAALFDLLSFEGIMHLCNGGQTSWHGFASEISAVAKKKKIEITCKAIYPVLSADFAQKATRPAFSVLDTTLARQCLGKFLPSWEESLQKYMGKDDFKV